jgi:hypothetical protein
MAIEKDEVKAKGGFARAEGMTAKERKQAAQDAALARWNPGIKRATHDGTLQFGDVTIPCAVLEDGTRVLTQKGVQTALGRSNQMGKRGDVGAEPLPAFLRYQSLKSFISDELSAASRPLVFIPKNGGKAFGFTAELLPMVCDAYLQARDEGELPHNQLPTARRCEMLVRSLAKVGIIALVDEATGYQEIRDRHALQAILDQYLAKELAAWAKRFPDEFYQQIFRLKGWEWKGMKVNRPQCVANYTKDIVYARLAPSIIQALEEKNPIDENGNRKAKHHQWLSRDVGDPALAQHLHAVTGFMRAADSWGSFLRMLDRAFPKKGDTLLLPMNGI